jgi:hypothetical protein
VPVDPQRSARPGRPRPSGRRSWFRVCIARCSPQFCAPHRVTMEAYVAIESTGGCTGWWMIEAAGLKPQLAAEPAEKQEKKWVSKPMCGHAALLDEPADLIVLGLPIGGELHLLHRHTGPESCVPLVPPWGQRWGQRKRLFRKKIGPFYWACPTVLLRTALL